MLGVRRRQAMQSPGRPLGQSPSPWPPAGNIVEDTGRFTGAVAGYLAPRSPRSEGRGRSRLSATVTVDPRSGTGGLSGLRGTVKVTGAATGPTTLAGSYEGQSASRRLPRRRLGLLRCSQ